MDWEADRTYVIGDGRIPRAWFWGRWRLVTFLNGPRAEVTLQQIAVAIARFAFKDYYERDRPQFTLLANVEAFLSDPASWDPNDPESPVTLTHEAVRR